MSESPATYCIDVTTLADAEPVTIAGGPRLTPTEGASVLTAYLMRRRDLIIAELREIDRLLNRPQTLPERQR